ncbi:uncharacterized protein LOC129774213 [Toxorhynchites rutilus septentrionalis]|uniref:uncharacterized protein LOC129774213 n=1 Tax=Toxorhynchites rutilus septentrionalis TaxID=329112 RepID=UPI002479EE3C|nr:uncharacterized protein LOC129774213 [Toxorhynchites rutilus septentrionalis]
MENLTTTFSEVSHITEFEKLLSEILTVYLPVIHTVCKIYDGSTGTLSDLKILPPIPTVSIEPNRDTVFNPLLAGVELGCNVFIVHQDSIIGFMDQFIECHDEATYRNPDKYIILLMDGAQFDEPILVNKLCDHPNLLEIMNLLILRPTANMESIELLTHRYVGPVEQSTDLLLVDIFGIGNNTFRYGNQFFPDKISNLQGKSIRLATFDIVPHIILQKSESGGPLVKLGNQAYDMDGVDGRLMVEFCQRYNCSVELIIDEVNMWGRIDANRTGNGILGNLAERRADVGLGAIGNWYEPLKFLTISQSTQKGAVTCLTPKPMPQPPWRVIFIAFSVPVWISTIAVYFIIVFMHFLMDQLGQTKKRQYNIARYCFDTFAIFLLQTAHLRKQKVSDVLLSVSLLLFAFNLGNIYSSKNASLRTVPLFEPSIDTLDDLAQSGLIWLQTHEAWILALLLSENPKVKTLISNFQAQPPSVLREMADRGNVAFVMGRLEHGHLMLGEWITAENIQKYQLMKEDLYYVYTVSMATKTWPLMGQFNKLTLRKAEVRLRHYQELEIIYKCSDYYVQTAAINSRLRESYKPRTLELIDLLGGFITLLFGVLASLIAFMIEQKSLLIKLKGQEQRHTATKMAMIK